MYFLIFFYSFILCNFSVRTLGYLFSNCKVIFWLWKHKKSDLKSSILMAVWIFFSLQPRLPRIDYAFYSFLYPIICGTISGILIIFIWLNLFIKTLDKSRSSWKNSLSYPYFYQDKIWTKSWLNWIKIIQLIRHGRTYL